MVRLEGYGDRKPAQLSGGQRQRVALARAIVNTPRALLLDEPLGALDLKLRQELQIELKQIQQELGMTFVYVTHDQEEALTMSDRIAVFNQGRIEQVGTPAEMYEHPATEFVAGLHRHVEHPRARRAHVHRAAGEDPALDGRGGRGRAGRDHGRRLPRPRHQVHRRARRRRRADGGAAEPRDVVGGRPRDGEEARPAPLEPGRGIRDSGGGNGEANSLRIRRRSRRSWRPLPSRRRASRRASALPTSVGAGEGKLTLVAWEGYTEKQWVAPFEKPTGLQGVGEVRRQLERHVQPDDVGRRRPVRHGLGLR